MVLHLCIMISKRIVKLSLSIIFCLTLASSTVYAGNKEPLQQAIDNKLSESKEAIALFEQGPISFRKTMIIIFEQRVGTLLADISDGTSKEYQKSFLQQVQKGINREFNGEKVSDKEIGKIRRQFIREYPKDTWVICKNLFFKIGVRRFYHMYTQS